VDTLIHRVTQFSLAYDVAGLEISRFFRSRSYFITSQFNPVHVFSPTLQGSVLTLFASFRSLLPPGPFLWYFLANILYAVLPSCCMMGVIPVSYLLGVSRQNESFSSALNASYLRASRLPSLSQWLPAMCIIDRSRIRTTYDRE
jgi:hypothetical protein